VLDWQPVERPQKWSGISTTASLADDSGSIHGGRRTRMLVGHSFSCCTEENLVVLGWHSADCGVPWRWHEGSPILHFACYSASSPWWVDVLSVHMAAKIRSIYLILLFRIGAKCAISLNVGIHFNACMPKTAAATFILSHGVVHTCAIDAARNIYCSIYFISFYMCGRYNMSPIFHNASTTWSLWILACGVTSPM